jgi:hemerythrin
MYMEWSPSMSVGIGDIDVQHRKMIRKINEISEAVDVSKSKEEIIEAIVFFEVYSEEHFKTEEGYMQVYRYPEYLGHQKEHRLLMDDMAKVREHFKQGKITAKEVYDESRRVANWFMAHMKIVDDRMAVFLRGKVK